MAGTIYGYNAPKRMDPQQGTGMSFKPGGYVDPQTQELHTNAANWEANLVESQRLQDLMSAGNVRQPGVQYDSPAPSGAMRPSMSALSGGGSQDMSAQWAREDQLRADQQRRQDELFNRFSGMFQSSGSPGRVSRTQGPSPAQEQASRDAAFARAKEKAGQTARASMTALNDAVAGSGMTGSSVHAANTGRIIGGAAGEIGEFLRDQAIQEADAATHRADLEYSGQVQQRGQELGRTQQMQQALLSLIGGLY